MDRRCDEITETFNRKFEKKNDRKDRFSYTKGTYADGKLMSSNKELRETKIKCRGNRTGIYRGWETQTDKNARKHNFKIMEILEEVQKNT